MRKPYLVFSEKNKSVFYQMETTH